jgi:hypothetical protein
MNSISLFPFTLCGTLSNYNSLPGDVDLMAGVLAHYVIRELQMIANLPERGTTEKRSSLGTLPPFAPASQSTGDFSPFPG